jgi:predicted transglutaminase-like cysteine proteinase
MGAVDLSPRHRAFARRRRMAWVAVGPLAATVLGPLAAAVLGAAVARAGEVAPAPCDPMALPIAAVGPAPTAYAEFCRDNPGDCTLRGPPQVPATPAVRAVLARVNVDVNAAVRFAPDTETAGEEELWRYPRRGRGDCEDIALEKRRRLVGLGMPGASLTMAIAFHRERLFSHAVLLAETDAGTLVLDSLDDAVACWQATPYLFETRERPDGRWLRFDQRAWHFGARASGVDEAPDHARR